MDNFYVITVIDGNSGLFEMIQYPKDDYDVVNVLLECMNDINKTEYTVINKFLCSNILENDGSHFREIKNVLLDLENSGSEIAATAKFQYALRGMREFWGL